MYILSINTVVKCENGERGEENTKSREITQTCYLNKYEAYNT